jgi:hypothetical protein
MTAADRVWETGEPRLAGYDKYVLDRKHRSKDCFRHPRPLFTQGGERRLKGAHMIDLINEIESHRPSSGPFAAATLRARSVYRAVIWTRPNAIVILAADQASSPSLALGFRSRKSQE